MTEFGQRHAAFLQPFPRLRLAAAALILGAALTGADILHGHRVLQEYPCPPSGKCEWFAHLVRPGWVDPVALGICLLGLAAAVGVLAPLRPFLRLTATALVLGAAVAGAVVLSGHRVVGAEHSCLQTAGDACFYHPRPGWVVPSMVGLFVLGLAGASGILVATRRRGLTGARPT